VDINKENDDGETPLSIVLDYDNEEIIQYLVEHGADFN